MGEQYYCLALSDSFFHRLALELHGIWSCHGPIVTALETHFPGLWLSRNRTRHCLNSPLQLGTMCFPG